MNNGNLLSSLMGATGAGSAAAKSTAPKSRADTAEKFQQAFEQARPEVAARKPVERKLPDRDNTTQRQVAAKPDFRPESVNRAADSKKLAKPAEGREPVAKDSSVASQQSPLKKATAGQSASDTANDSTQTENQTLVDAASEKVTAVLLDTNEPSPEDIAAFVVAPVTAEISDDADSEEELLIPLLADAGTDEPAVPLVPDAALTGLSGVDNSGVDLAAIGADIRVVGMNSLNPAAANGVVVSNASSTASSSPLVDDILSAQAAPATETLVSAEGENSDAVNLADNPDFALLNTKAGFSKMMDANLASLDKAAPSAELTKPVAAQVSVLESVVRPLESQSPAARAFVVQTGVPVAMGSPQWSQAVGDKVLWLAAQNVSAAEIRLDPPELGPMQVRVTVNQDQANVTFTSHNPVVRDALDQQLNRLREMFSEQGLNLVNVDVSDKSFAQQERDQEGAGKSRSNGGDVDDDELMPVAMTQVASTYLVDHYA